MRVFGRGLILLALFASLPALAATKLWTGFGGNPNWSNPMNWGSLSAPVNGDDLVFPLGPTNLTSGDDIGITPNSYLFQGGGYSVGSLFFMGLGSLSVAAGGTVTMTAPTGTVSFFSPLASSGSFSISIGSGGTLSLPALVTAMSGNVTKNGGGTLAVTGPPQILGGLLMGTMAVNAGTLNVQDATAALGATGSPGTTVASGATLQVQGGITVPETLTLSGTGVGSAGALESVSGNNTWTGTVAMAANASFGSDAGTLTISGVVSGAASLTKVGTGTLILPAVNTYTGATSVNAGILTATNASSLGSNASAVVNGGTLQLDGTAASFTLAKSLTLTGTGASGQGALDNLVGTNAINGGVTLQPGAVGVGVDAGTLTLSTGVSGGGGLTKVGAGTLQLNGGTANTYAGTTNVNNGILNLNHTAAGVNAVPGALVIGDGSGAAGSRQVVLLASNQIADAGAVTVNGDGVLQLNANADTIGSLTMTGGDVKFTSGGTLTLGGTLSKPSGANAATIGVFPGTGTLVLPATRTFDTAGTSSPDLQIYALIQGAGGITKNGPGRVNLANLNTYTGATMVNGGNLFLQNPQGLGDIGTGTTINAGGMVETGFSPFAMADEPLTLNGGTFKAGFTTSFNGPITLASDSFLQIGGGTFTLTSVISGPGGFTLTDVSVSGATILVGGNSTYAGTTVVNSGTLQVNGANALGAAAGATVVANGATLGVNGSFTVPETLTLNGTGISGNGALRSIAGTNTISGGVILATGSSVGVPTAAGQLTLSGVISGAAGAGLTKIGLGTLILPNANSYTGTTTVNAGTLRVNGSQPQSAVALAAGTLGGSGAVGDVNGAGGTLAPGQSPGILATGNLTLGATDTFAVELNGTTSGTQYDQLNVTGTVGLGNAALSTTVGYSPMMGDTYTIISNDVSDAVTGAFANLPEGASFAIGANAFSITYAGGTNSNDVVLTNVPCTAPSASNPANQTVCPSGTATFTTTASGVGPLTYQWRKGMSPLMDGGNITGATSPTLMIANATATDAGSYDVVVNGGCAPPFTTAAATLTVGDTTNPVVTAPSSATVTQTLCN
ncbi:MAG TPA: autotransporter-associated beta strand repeat-containing protein [Thermoanaerobaculia bacterium]|nr:autotransporter-associated beta strand repeat-containing protein [Thermoanaerobaculia bacterium]